VEWWPAINICSAAFKADLKGSNAGLLRWNRIIEPLRVAGCAMNDSLHREIQAIRTELADLKRESQCVEAKRFPREPGERLSTSEGFIHDFKMHLADQFLRQPGRARIHQRLDMIEQRVAELEARYGASPSVSSTPR
jgi:hypothetical protein